jgi:hypothetical protein
VNAPAQLSLKLINPHVYPQTDNHPNLPNSSSYTDSTMRSSVNAFANYRPNPYLPYPELPVAGYSDISSYNNSNSSSGSSQAPTPQTRTVNPYANPGTPASVNVSSLNVNPNDKRNGTPMAAYPQGWHHWHHGPPLPEPLPYSNVYYPVNSNLPDSQNLINSVPVSVATSATPSFYQTHQQLQTSVHSSSSHTPLSQQQQVPQYHQQEQPRMNQEQLYYSSVSQSTENSNFENSSSSTSNKSIISSSALLPSNGSSTSLVSFLSAPATAATSSSQAKSAAVSVVKNPVYVDPYCDLLDGFDNFPLETIIVKEEKIASVRPVTFDKAVNTDITQATLFPTL